VEVVIVGIAGAAEIVLLDPIKIKSNVGKAHESQAFAVIKFGNIFEGDFGEVACQQLAKSLQAGVSSRESQNL